MFVKKIIAQNFRLFSADKVFEVNEINIPDSTNEGTGLTVFVGENGCGKTSLLDAIALPLLSYVSMAYETLLSHTGKCTRSTQETVPAAHRKVYPRAPA